MPRSKLAANKRLDRLLKCMIVQYESTETLVQIWIVLKHGAVMTVTTVTSKQQQLGVAVKVLIVTTKI